MTGFRVYTANVFLDIALAMRLKNYDWSLVVVFLFSFLCLSIPALPQYSNIFHLYIIDIDTVVSTLFLFFMVYSKELQNDYSMSSLSIHADC